MEFTKESIIKDSIIKNPEIIEVLEKKNINYYDKALRTFGEVNGDSELYDKLNSITKHSSKSEDLKEAINSDKRTLIKYIKQNHHRKELDLLNLIEDYMERVLKAHYTEYDNIPDVYRCFMEIKSSLNIHFVKEEKVEFLAILKNETFNKVNLEKDNEKIINLLEKLYLLTNKFTAPEDTCPTHVKLYELMNMLHKSVHRHIFIEKYILFSKF